jgi:hypothetical protein
MPLPSVFRLPTYFQDQLQSAIITAAAAGQRQSLALLLQQLSVTACRNNAEQLDLLCSAMESAAAAGSQACLDILWKSRSQPAAANTSCSSAIKEGQQLTAQLQQVKLAAGNLHGRQLQQRLLCSSRFCLVAAAGSGNAQLLSKLLQEVPQGVLVTQQLPAALQAAGKQGHVAALQVLLEQQEMSSRPLQVSNVLVLTVPKLV